MFWSITAILFVIYVIFSLSTIKYQLKRIITHLNIQEKKEWASDEEIEKELENDLKRD